jgi:dipeptidyl aminopeptidase/acylaminoacyl peptidase
MKLPAGPDILVTNLEDRTLIPTDDPTQGPSPDDSSRAISMSAPQWSHNGRYIAFVGQHEGPTSDLYVYDVVENSISRLTDGPSHSYNPVWSPDDAYIFSPGAWAFGTGAGYSNAGSWIVSRDGSKIIETSGTGTDEVVGWQTPHRFLMASWRQPCGLGSLKSYDIDQGSFTDVWPYSFEDLSFTDTTGILVMVVPPEFSGMCSPEIQPTGLIVFDKIGSLPKTISDGSFQRIESDPSNPGAFLLRKWEGWFRLTLPDTIQELPHSPASWYLFYSPVSHLWLWYNDDNAPGLWVGNLVDEPKLIMDGEITNAAWSPDGKTIFFVSQDDHLLYLAQGPYFQVHLVSTTTTFNTWGCPNWSCFLWANP